MHQAFTTFVLQAIVIITVSRVLGLAARRVRQPMVVAEIIAGIMLGPSLLGAIAPGWSQALFPKESLGILNIVSQLGLVLFMFLVGLELNPAFLKERGRTSVIISHSSIVVPFALGAALALRLHASLAPQGTPLSSFALFMGVAMSITAFPVLARILTERRLLGTEIGAVTIACAAIDDVTAWCLLAFVVSIAKTAALSGALVTTVLTVSYVAAMMWLVRPLLARAAARYGGPEAISQQMVAGTLVLLLVSASITEAIGIHALFGAFAFGLTIPRSGHFARALAEKTEDLVVVLLLPLFFAYSGLRTRIGLIEGFGGWLTCGLIILVACAGKFGGSYVAARWTGLPRKDACVLGLLMNTRGLMELVALNIGYDLGVISQTLFTMMVLMAVVTTVMTTPLLALLEGRASVRGVTEPSFPGLQVAAPIFSVLVCTAYQRSAQGMLAIARTLVRQNDKVYALRLLAPNERSSEQIAAQEPDVRLSTLSGVVEHAAQFAVTVRPISFVSADPSRDICDVAAVKGVDLIVLGWHRPWFGRAPLGGTVEKVLGRADGSVAVLLDRRLEADVRSAVVVLQGTPDDPTVLRLAGRMQEGGCAIRVVDLTGTFGEAGLAAAGLSTQATHLVQRAGRDDEAVVSACADSDLLLIGLAGPLADGQLFDRLPCSLLLVRRSIAPATSINGSRRAEKFGRPAEASA